MSMDFVKMITVVLGLMVALIGVPTAIFQLKKAYIEKKRTNSEKESHIMIGKEIKNGDKATDSNNIINIYNDTVSNMKSSSHNEGILTDDIILKERYTSLFAENGEVHSENIEIKNLEHGRISGKVFLDDNNTYNLVGVFKNRVLTGEFTSVGKHLDERGTVNLKLISEDILSGFCSFSKISTSVEDQIRISPYVWSAGKDANLINGTYEFCTQCHNERRKCCCASADIDMPILLKNEAQKLQSRNSVRLRMRDFSRNIGNTPILQMLPSNRGEEHCHFYDSSENKCNIYDIRPTDCRLFPFDIKLDSDTNEYWVGYYTVLIYVIGNCPILKQ